MVPFILVYIGRSDGQTQLVSKSRKKELNRPTEQQLDSTPDNNGAVDYYRLLAKDSPKEADWRRKLGGMLMREIEGKENKGALHLHCPLFGCL